LYPALGTVLIYQIFSLGARRLAPAATFSAGVGAGVNVLFGGSNRTIALRPFALEGEIEVAIGLGVSSLKLATAF
jgi:Protein of unknown function (DUF992)